MRGRFTGLPAWLAQRISAVYMLFFIAFLLVHFTVDPPHSYSAWHDWMTSAIVGIGTTLFLAALLAHAWVGARDVILDYAHPMVFRVGLLVFLGVGLTGLGAWVMQILWIERG